MVTKKQIGYGVVIALGGLTAYNIYKTNSIKKGLKQTTKEIIDLPKETISETKKVTKGEYRQLLRKGETQGLWSEKKGWKEPRVKPKESGQSEDLEKTKKSFGQKMAEIRKKKKKIKEKTKNTFSKKYSELKEDMKKAKEIVL
jgi:hypothetical protein